MNAAMLNKLSAPESKAQPVPANIQTPAQAIQKAASAVMMK